MELPDNYGVFKSLVKSRIRTYCDTKIWPFDIEVVHAWLGNFDSEIDEYVALQLLDSLIVRSKEMAISSYQTLFNSLLWQVLKENDILRDTDLLEWISKLKSGRLAHLIKFLPVKIENEHGESGSTIYRMLSSILETNYYAFTPSTNAPKALILIDDFLGSGRQFTDQFAAEFKLDEQIKHMTIIYCPLVALESGICNLIERFPKLIVLPCEVLKDEHAFLNVNQTSLFKNDQKNTVKDVIAHFMTMKEKYAPKSSYWMGDNDSCIPIVFQWGCPNQAPSILWHRSDRGNWNQLFGRRL
ncbi:hypothetical protein [Rheinheimera sp. F8]|uniref:phosphoribosyltransferase-like protein n=1 Tax=Rheinheimera sp. F8 TaxID=1763998 RepID=UPI00074490F9|nr:hypothetical protein [Rheinheimera sp. F8]ALZ75378.1 hypothetical protein ATY27_06170 [Rheinheimera sp. F8]ALZ75808.1 hypothetical protein ATY27_08535 [Rheinheimera sp. F8]